MSVIIPNTPEMVTDSNLQRGVIVASFQIFTNTGQFIGAVVSNALHNNLTKLSYQIQLAILYFVPVWLMITVWFLPESPRWLAVQGNALCLAGCNTASSYS